MMQLTHDPRHNVAYLRLREKTSDVETIRISDALNVDLAPDGTVYGIELLNAIDDYESKRLVLESRAAGVTRQMPH